MKAVIKYLKNREATIDSLLSKPRHKYTPATFHKLRVEIKKLNALFDLINYCLKDFKRKKTFKPFKLIFQQAGKVRELQLEETMLKKYLTSNSLNNYRNNLKKLRLKEQDDYFLLLKNKFVVRLKNKYHRISPLFYKINNKKANNYLEKKKNRIKELLSQGKLNPEQIHKLRKRLKMLNYNMKCLSSKKQDEQLFNKDVLSGLLGKWHDCQVMTKHLEKAKKVGIINSKEINQLEKIKGKIDSDIELIFSKINTAIAEHVRILNKFT